MAQIQNNIPKAVFNNLNLVRVLSGLTVLFSHYFQIFVISTEGRSLFRNFAIHFAIYAVLTFFVLSGFLIALSIQRNIRQYCYFNWKIYLISRVARIYPALVASVLLCFVLHAVLTAMGMGGPDALVRASDVLPPARTGFMVNYAEAISTLLQVYAFGPGGYLNSNGPLWSLSYEVGFYLCAGLLMTALKGRGISRPLSGGGMILVIAMSIHFNRPLFLHYASIWMLGVILFFVLDALGRKATGAISVKSLSLRLAILSAFIIGVNVFLATHGSDEPLLGSFVAALAIVAILLAVCQIRTPLFLGMAKLADSTYTLYLFHFPILLFAYAFIRDLHDRSTALYFLLSLAITLALIPVCLVVAKVLEDRRLWEAFLGRFAHQPIEK